MRLHNLDLNLLVALDALLVERSVTAAARRLGTSQPTMSARLALLRRHFDDELLTRTGNRYALTALAARLRPEVAQVLAGAERLLSAKETFDPTTSDRRFTLMSSDYGMTVVVPVLHRLLAARAPAVRLHLRAVTVDALQDLEPTMAAVDLLVLPRGVVQWPAHLPLCSDEWVAVVDGADRRVGEALTMDDLAERAWVVTAGEQSGTAASVESIPVVRQLQLLGVQPRVHVVAESFAVVPALVAGTGRIAVLQRRLVEAVPSGGVRVLPLPFTPVPLVEAAWWHPSRRDDSGHRWLRRCLVDVAAALGAEEHREDRWSV